MYVRVFHEQYFCFDESSIKIINVVGVVVKCVFRVAWILVGGKNKEEERIPHRQSLTQR